MNIEETTMKIWKMTLFSAGAVEFWRSLRLCLGSSNGTARKKGLVKANYILVLRNAVRQLTRITLRSSRPLYAMAFIPVLWRKARF